MVKKAYGRVRVKPRSELFFPWHAARGPGRKTRLDHVRRTEGVQGVGEQSESFELIDNWNAPSQSVGEKKGWIGSTTFFVDKVSTPEWGTDQRRQRTEAQLFLRIIEDIKERHLASIVSDHN